MADLFSKDYLKELLSADGLDDMFKTTAKAGLESIADKIADGEEEGISIADKILNSGDGIVRDIAQDTLAKASEDGIDTAKKDLFSGEYLKEVLESDYLNDRIDKKTADSPVLQAAVERGREEIDSAFSQDEAVASEDIEPLEEEVDFEEEDEYETIEESLDVDLSEEEDEPIPLESYTEYVDRSEFIPRNYDIGGIPKSNSSSTGNSRRALGITTFAVLALALVLLIGVGSCVNNNNSTTKKTVNPYSAVSSTYKEPKPYEIEEVVALGRVVDTEDTVEYLQIAEGYQVVDLENEWDLSQLDEGTIIALLICDNGEHFVVDNSTIKFVNYDNNELQVSSNFKMILNANLPLEYLPVWYPNAQDLTWYEGSYLDDLLSGEGVDESVGKPFKLLDQNVKISKSYIINSTRGDHMGDETSVLGLKGYPSYNGDETYAFVAYSSHNGGVVYDLPDGMACYDQGAGVFHLPASLAPVEEVLVEEVSAV